MIPAPSTEKGAAEVIGALILISVLVTAMALVAVAGFSRPAPDSVPAVNIVITNESRAISVYHAGGDPIPASEAQILVDGVASPFTGAGSDEIWSLGETLTYTAPWMPARIDVVFTGPSHGQQLLATLLLGNETSRPAPGQ
jgi:FlaG/FlaF family flagellin (archaellin)